ncbi:MAG: hypothetical protein ACQETB_07330 [Halobacteriota archaeon]
MPVTRRNTLIGLGGIVGGAGLITSTGAFTAVEADRTVSVSATGDATAMLALAVNDDQSVEGTASSGDDLDVYGGTATDYADYDGDLLAISIENLNLEGRTTFEDLLTVTNNGTQSIDLTVQEYGDDVDAGGVDGQGNPVVDFKLYDGDDGPASIVGDTVEVGVGETLGVTIEINLRGVTTTGDADDRLPEEVTIEANAN